MTTSMTTRVIADPARSKETGLTWLTLFATTGTLVCCALPIILVTLGLGATVASLVSAVPLLITLSQYKILVFIFSGTMLALSGWLIYRPKRVCPTDPETAAMCHKSQFWNRRIYWFSIILWGTGFFAAFLALPLRIWLDG